VANGQQFGVAADAYEAGRPEYPLEAVAWMLEGTKGTVLDLGAGTGKLTRGVLALGREAIAVDPDSAMLARLTSELPDVRAEVGTAEAIPLPDASVGAVVVGQAWHWVDVPRASREVARVLAPGGVLGLIWNVRDEREPWVAAMTVAMHGSVAEALIAAGGPTVAVPFGPLEELRVEWSRPMTRDAIEAMVRSRSYFIAADAAGRAEADERVGAVLDGVGSLAGGGSVSAPYVSAAYRTGLRRG
jgi:SAM-dependent methyltransferase